MFAQLKKITATLFAAILLNASTGAALAQDHGHSHPAAEGAAQLSLNNGKKWATDDNLRQSMGRIRDALTAELPAIHSGKATAEQYRALAQKTNDQIAFIVKNCKVDQQTDAILHLVLADIIAGADMMMGHNGSTGHEGAGKIARALDNYGTYFDHPGWHGAVLSH